MTLYWRANGPLDKNYTVFTHLLDANESVLVNADHAPPRPSRGWAAAEIVADPVTLTIPAALSRLPDDGLELRWRPRQSG